MTLKNNKAPLLYYFKLCASFRSHWWYQTGVTVRKRPIKGQNRRFFEPRDLEIWRMILNHSAPLLCFFKLCASFCSHCWNQTGVTVRKRPIWVKIDDFLAVWPGNLTDDLEKQEGTSPKQHQALCIISSSYVNSNWSYGPEMVGLWPLWPSPLTSDFDLSHGHQFCHW